MNDIEIIEDSPKKNKNKGLIIVIVIVLLIGLSIGGYFLYKSLNKETIVVVDDGFSVDLTSGNYSLLATPLEIKLNVEKKDNDTREYGIIINKNTKKFNIEETIKCIQKDKDIRCDDTINRFSEELSDEEYDKVKNILKSLTLDDIGRFQNGLSVVNEALLSISKDEEKYNDITYREYGIKLLDDFVNNKDKKEEKLITDSSVVSKLNKNVERLNGHGDSQFIIEDLYKKELIDTLDGNIKLKISLGDYEEDKKEPSKEIKERMGVFAFSQYDALELIDNYNKLFSDKISESDLKDFNGYYYDGVNKKYYKNLVPALSVVNIKNYGYNYQYTTDGDYYFVDRAVGYTDSSDGFNVHASYIDVSKLYTGDGVSVENKIFDGINLENYVEFDQFRFVFEKDDNDNYVFKSIEKVINENV